MVDLLNVRVLIFPFSLSLLMCSRFFVPHCVIVKEPLFFVSVISAVYAYCLLHANLNCFFVGCCFPLVARYKAPRGAFLAICRCYCFFVGCYFPLVARYKAPKGAFLAIYRCYFKLGFKAITRKQWLICALIFFR